MAHTTTLVSSGPNHVTYTVVEAGTAVAVAEARDVLANLTTAGFGAGNPLFDALNQNGVAWADQPAAIVGVNTEITIAVSVRVQSAGDASSMTFIPNISGGAIGNFRLDIQGVKAANADTAEFVITLQHRHSIFV
jgi:hypothetical protein